MSNATAITIGTRRSALGWQPFVTVTDRAGFYRIYSLPGIPRTSDAYVHRADAVAAADRLRRDVLAMNGINC
jgi:hypothetical protein